MLPPGALVQALLLAGISSRGVAGAAAGVAGTVAGVAGAVEGVASSACSAAISLRASSCLSREARKRVSECACVRKAGSPPPPPVPPPPPPPPLPTLPSPLCPLVCAPCVSSLWVSSPCASSPCVANIILVNQLHAPACPLSGGSSVCAAALDVRVGAEVLRACACGRAEEKLRGYTCVLAVLYCGGLRP